MKLCQHYNKEQTLIFSIRAPDFDTRKKNPNLQICVSDFRDNFTFKFRIILGAVSKAKYFNHFSNFNALYIYIYIFYFRKSYLY